MNYWAQKLLEEDSTLRNDFKAALDLESQAWHAMEADRWNVLLRRDHEIAMRLLQEVRREIMGRLKARRRAT